MANATSTQLQELYVAYFGRAADPTGLDYWTEKGITTAKFAADMHAQAEFSDAYGSLSTESQVNQIYQNLFDREADATGLLYWTKEIDLGNLQLAEIATHLIWAAQNNSGSEDDKTALTNKTNAAVAYTAKVKETTSAILAYQAESTSPWKSGVNITEAVSYMSGIDKDTESTTAGIASSVTTITNNGVPSLSKNYSLTSGIDDIDGTAGTNKISAGLTSSGGNTINSLDEIDGGAGTDTLNASIATTITPGEIKNVENVNLTFEAAKTFNATNVTGVTTYTDVGSTAAGTISNIGDLAAKLKVSDNAVGATFTYQTNTVTGTADSVDLTLSNATGGNAKSTVITGAIETLNLTSSTSANSVRLDTAATTLNISGDQDLTLGASSTALDNTTTIDASNATGAITFAHDHASAAVTITGGSGNDSITLTGTAQTVDTVSGGAGDDTFTFTHNSDLTDTDVIDGGAGTDTLVGDDGELVALTTANNISNIEVIESDSSLAIGTLTVANIDSAIKSVTLAAGASSGTVTFGAGTNTLTLGTASGGVLVVNDTGLATTDVLNIVTSKAADSGNAKNFTINGFETVNVDTSTATAKTFGTINVVGDPDSAGIKTSATLDIDGSISFASGVITLGSATTGTGTINASDLTANFSTSGAAVGVTTITGGSGNDTILGEDLASTLTGGAGNDAITGGTKSDTIAGGAGNDTITLSAASTAAEKDTITGGAGNDVFSTADANLVADHVIDGGAGTDSISLTDITAVADSQLQNKTNIEVLTSASSGLAATLDVYAQAMGITTVTLAGSSTAGINDTVTIQDDVTNAITVNLDDGDYVDSGSSDDDSNTVDATLYTGVLTVTTATADSINGANASDLSITGGTGTSDTLNFHGAALSSTEIGSITKIENFVQIDDVASSIVLATGTVADGKALTIDARSIISPANAFGANLTNETDGVITVHGGTGVDTVTASASDLGDTINTYAGADFIDFQGAYLTTLDTVDGGSGTDTIRIVTAGATLADADFTNVSNVEALTFSVASSNTDLGAEYSGSGSVTITLTTGTNDLNLDSVTTAQTLNLVAGTDTIDASSMTEALTVKYAASVGLTGNDTITAGTGTSDVLQLTYGNTAAILTNVTGFETIKGGTNAAQTITTVDGNVAATKSMTIDMTANTGTTATVNIAAETDGAITILGGASANTIVLSVSSMGDTFTGGAGNDGVSVQDDQLTSADTINGVSGTDTLTIVGNGSIADSDFTNVTNFDTLALGTGGANTFVLGAEYQEAGFTAVTGAAVDDTITFGAGVTTNQTVTLSTGSDTISAAGSAATYTFDIAHGSITTNDTITGGSGSSDKLLVTFATTQITAADMSKVTGIEEIEAKTTAAFDLVLSDANAVSSVLTVDMADATNAGTVDATAEDDGTINYIGGTAADTVLGAATTATGDTISTGAGNDIITGQGGGDTITGGAGADTFTYTAVAHSTGSARDSVTDFTSTTDKFAITIDESAKTGDLVFDTHIGTARAGTSLVQSNLSGNIGQAIYDTTNSRLIVNANADNLVTTLDYQIDVNAATTAANTFAEGDINWTVSGGSGADTFTMGDGVNTVNGNGGIDTIHGGSAVDTINGGAGADIINGNDGADIITPGEGADIIDAGAGNDVITLTETTSAVDTVTLTNGASTADFITGFVITADNISALDSTHTWYSAETNANTDGSVILIGGTASLKAAHTADSNATVLAITATLTANTYDGFIAGTTSETTMETAAITAMGATGAIGASDIVMVLLDDNEHTGVWKFTSADAIDNAVVAGEIELMGILKGIANATTIAAGDVLFA